MGFEHEPVGQLTLLLFGLALGLFLRGKPANGLFAIAAAGLPFLGFGLTQWFC
jgi:hypothetical protein